MSWEVVIPSLSRIDSPEVFESLASSFIDDELLGPGSLFPGDDAVTAAHGSVLIKAIRYLVRYRFFTQSHVRRLLDADAAFRNSLERSKWSVENLWSALGGSALLLTDLDAWLMQYISFPLVYGFQRIARECGLYAKRTLCISGNVVIWRGQNDYHKYDGSSVTPLRCTVWDFIFNNIDNNYPGAGFMVAETSGGRSIRSA